MPVIRPRWAANVNGASNFLQPVFRPTSARSHSCRMVTLPVSVKLAENFGLHQEFGRRFKARTTAQKIVKAQPIGRYRFGQYQASGWTKRTMVASKTLRPPYNFDFSKNREYTALRIAGGKRKKRIENAFLTDDSAPPNDVARGRRIRPSTTRSKLIAPSSASRNRNDDQFLICRKKSTQSAKFGGEAVYRE
jgi:hypothetical protein